MTKQEEIREWIAHRVAVPAGGIPNYKMADLILKYEDSQGVVIEVERELPQEFLDGLEGLLNPHSEFYYKSWPGIGVTQVKNFIKEQAGCGFFEPLIKEG